MPSIDELITCLETVTLRLENLRVLLDQGQSINVAELDRAKIESALLVVDVEMQQIEEKLSQLSRS